MLYSISITLTGYGDGPSIERQLISAGFQPYGIDPNGDVNFLGDHTWLFRRDDIELAFTPTVNSPDSSQGEYTLVIRRNPNTAPGFIILHRTANAVVDELEPLLASA